MGNICCWSKDYHRREKSNRHIEVTNVDSEKELNASDIANEIALIEEKDDGKLSKGAEEILSRASAEFLSQDHVKAGELMKRSEWKHEWKKRYLVLKDGRLYSSKDKLANPNNVVLVDIDSTVEHAENTLTEKSKKILSEKPGLFIVTDSTGHSFALAPTMINSFDGKDWIHKLEECIKDAKELERYKLVLLPKLQSGSTFTKKNFSKLGRFSTRDQNRIVNVSSDCRSIIWHKPEVAEFDEIHISDITNVSRGAESAVFLRHQRTARIRYDPNCCFSISTEKRTLDLIASNASERDLWVDGLLAVKRFGSVLSDEQLEKLCMEKRAKIARNNAQAITEQRRKDERREGLTNKLSSLRSQKPKSF